MFALVEDSLVDMWTRGGQLQWGRLLDEQNRNRLRTYQPNRLSNLGETAGILPIHVLQLLKPATTKKSLQLVMQPCDSCEILEAICVRHPELSFADSRFYWRIGCPFVPRTSSTTISADFWGITIHTRCRQIQYGRWTSPSRSLSHSPITQPSVRRRTRGSVRDECSTV
jgi:hypothetical protein